MFTNVEIKWKDYLENNEIFCDPNDDADGKDSDGDVADNHVLGNHLFRSVGPTQWLEYIFIYAAFWN